MEMGIGFLGWSPEQFWNATHNELICGIHGKNPKLREDMRKKMQEDRNRQDLAKWLEGFDENGDPIK